MLWDQKQQQINNNNKTHCFVCCTCHFHLLHMLIQAASLACVLSSSAPPLAPKGSRVRETDATSQIASPSYPHHCTCNSLQHPPGRRRHG
jgi:hypothetical protein